MDTQTAAATAAEVPFVLGGALPSEERARVRHDLRTPLNQIIGYSDLLIEEAAEESVSDSGDNGSKGAERIADLGKIRDAAARLSDMLDSLLTAETAAFAGQPIATGSESEGRQTTAATETTAAATAATAAATLADYFPHGEMIGGLILVVDDDEANRDLLTRLLEREGHTIVTAASGEEALSLAQEGVFDLILLDVMMPGLDGPAVLARLKEDERLRLLPVIVLSALDETDASVRCIALGAEDYLPKPWDPILLRARIGASLEKKRLRDRDLRYREKLEDSFRQLQDLQKLRDDMTHMIVHDLRTPLTSLLTGLQTLPLLGEMNGDQQEFLQMAESGGQTLLGMINDLLDLSKLEDGSLTLDREPVDARAVIYTAEQQVAHLAKDRGLHLATDIASDLPAVFAEEEKLRRVLVNLLGNALKFTPRDGTITLSARRGEGQDAGFAVFSVRDTGEGIPEAAFQRIFEKFGQVEDRKAGRKNSTGLGLTFCRMVTEAHGGRIWVESTLGVGSVFLFTIPFA